MKVSKVKELIRDLTDDEDVYAIIWTKDEAEKSVGYEETGQTLDDDEWANVVQYAEKDEGAYAEAEAIIYELVLFERPLDQGCPSCNANTVKKCRCDAE